MIQDELTDAKDAASEAVGEAVGIFIGAWNRFMEVSDEAMAWLEANPGNIDCPLFTPLDAAGEGQQAALEDLFEAYLASRRAERAFYKRHGHKIKPWRSGLSLAVDNSLTERKDDA